MHFNSESRPLFQMSNLLVSALTLAAGSAASESLKSFWSGVLIGGRPIQGPLETFYFFLFVFILAVMASSIWKSSRIYYEKEKRTP